MPGAQGPRSHGWLCFSASVLPDGGGCRKVPTRTGEERFIPGVLPQPNGGSSAQTALASTIAFPFPPFAAEPQISPK